jgi:hypothetical protein
MMIASVDTNIWGFIAMPLGVVVCFGPALAVWIKKEYFSGPPSDQDHGL